MRSTRVRWSGLLVGETAEVIAGHIADVLWDDDRGEGRRYTFTSVVEMWQPDIRRGIRLQKRPVATRLTHEGTSAPPVPQTSPFRPTPWGVLMANYRRPYERPWWRIDLSDDGSGPDGGGWITWISTWHDTFAEARDADRKQHVVVSIYDSGVVIEHHAPGGNHLWWILALDHPFTTNGDLR